MSDADTKTTAGSGGEPEVTIESLQAQLVEQSEAVAALTAEATKNKALRRKAEQERDDLKTKVKTSDGDKDYKALWTQTNEKLTKTLEKAKSADINAALTDQLGKAKVASDKFGAARKLIDSTLIEWDEDAGIDQQSIVAAVQKLKSEHGFLFETTVQKTDVKNPGEAGSTTTIARSAFDALSPTDKAAKVKAKVKIID
jgi:hypothetical protein